MKIERQRMGECMLSVLAALANKSLAEIREVAFKHAKTHDWFEILYEDKLLWPATRHIVRRYKITGMPVKLPSLTTITGSRLNFKGRGSVTIKVKDWGSMHIMYFENNIIYDSDEFHNQPFAADKLGAEYYKGWSIVQVLHSR